MVSPFFDPFNHDAVVKRSNIHTKTSNGNDN